MTSQSIEVVNKIASKVGILNSETISKACDHVRNLNSKSNVSVNEMLKSLICLDIASEQLGDKFDKPAALKLAVITRSNYQKSYLLVKNLLQIENKKTIFEICVQLGVENVSKLAEALYNKYKECDTINRDFNHPQYVTAAVFTICKLRKIPLKRSDCATLSTLKPHQWVKLETEFLKFAEEHNFKPEPLKKSTKKGNEVFNYIEQKSVEFANAQELESKNEDFPEMEEPYEEWKCRILEEAFAYVKNLNYN